MRKKGLNDVQINVSMPSDLTDWLDEMVKAAKFSSRSHGIRRCIRIAKDDPEVTRKL